MGRRKSPNVMSQSHAFLGQGAYGCVFDKPLRCTQVPKPLIISETSNKHLVSKIFRDKDAYEKEVIASRLAASVDPTGKALLLPTTACEVDEDVYNTLSDSYKCKHSNSDEISFASTINRQMYQLIMPFGGTRIDETLRNMLHGVPIKKFLTMIGPLIDSLVMLDSHKICHNDIKGANVLMTPQGKAILIDHSLMIPYDVVYSSQKYRRLHMSYYPYPPEYRIVFNVINDALEYSIDDVYDSLSSFGTRRYEAYRMFIEDKYLDNQLNKVMKKIATGIKVVRGVVKERQVIDFMSKYVNRVDVYGMGMLFVSIAPYITYKKASEKLEAEFKKFIISMIEPNMVVRATPKKVAVAYKALLKMV